MVKLAVVIVVVLFVLGLFYFSSEIREFCCIGTSPDAHFDYRELCTTPDPIAAKLGPPTRELRTTIDQLRKDEWDRLTFAEAELDRLPQHQELVFMVWEWHCLGEKRGQIGLLAEPDTRKAILMGDFSTMYTYLGVRYPGNQPPNLPCLGWKNPAR